jgi:hypothetical protein
MMEQHAKKFRQCRTGSKRTSEREPEREKERESFVERCIKQLFALLSLCVLSSK